MKNLSSLTKNIIFNFIGQFLLIILGFISFKFIFKGLGEDALGIIYFTLILSGLLTSALDLGLSKTTTREIAFYSQSNKDYIIKLTQTFSLFYWVAYIIVIILFVILLPKLIHNWINLKTMNEHLAFRVLLILGIASLLSIPRMLMTSIIVGLQRMDINNSIEVFFAIVQQIGMIALIIKGKDVISVSYCIATVNLLKILTYMYFVAKLISIKSIFPFFSLDVVKKVKNYTSKMMLVSMFMMINKQIDKIVISKFMAIGTVGIYSFAFSLVSKTSLITEAIAQAIFPTFSELEKKGLRSKSLEKFFYMQDLLVYGTIPIYTALICFSLPVITIIIDSDKAKELQITIIILCISFYLNAVLRLVRTFIFAIDKPDEVIKSDILTLFIITPSTIFFVIKWGMNGAASSLVLYYVIMAFYIVPKVYRRDFEKSPYFWFKDVLLAVAIAFIAYFPSIYLAQKFSFNILNQIIGFILSTFIYIIIVVKIGVKVIKDAIQKIVSIKKIFNP